jgi:hypothetical protein
MNGVGSALVCGFARLRGLHRRLGGALMLDVVELERLLRLQRIDRRMVTGFGVRG